jgi:membrane associated rhomboid family serine protease
MQASAVAPLRLVFLMWLLFSLEHYLQYDLGFLGIYPLSFKGLVGILTAPMIHGNFNHLISNTIPLLALGGALYFFYPPLASRVFLYAYFFTNILVWVFGRPFYHIGASGIIYALASFLIFYGFVNRNFKSVLISIIVLAVYGGLAFGVLPVNQSVSWESHLMGALVGIVSAFIFGKQKQYY